MDYGEAIMEIVRDSRNRKPSTASAKRVLKACKVLGLNDQETRRLFSGLDYCDGDTFEPWNWRHGKIERVWP